MSSFFSLESPFYKFMSRLLDMLKLNVLWLLSSGVVLKFVLDYLFLVFGLESFRVLSFIPMITMGAATTAVYAITLRMVDEEEGYIAKTFFQAFKENFKQGTILGIIQMVAIYAIWIDFQFYNNVTENNIIFLIVGVIAILMTFMHTVYAFPLLARYENTLINTMRNSYSLMIRFLPRTIFLVIILVVEFAIIFWNNTTIFLGILIGPACIMLTVSGPAMYVFRRIENENETNAVEAEDNEDMIEDDEFEDEEEE